MRYALDPLITAIINKTTVEADVLSYEGNPLKVFTAVSIENDIDNGIPVIVITPSDGVEIDVTKDSLGHEYTIEIACATKYPIGLGGWGTNNDVMNQLLAKFRPDVDVQLPISDNFNVIGQMVESIFPEVDSYKESVIYMTTLRITFMVQDLIAL